VSRRLLVLDAYDEAGREALSGAGATHAGELYRRLLSRLAPEVSVEVLPFSSQVGFAPSSALAEYDGIVWSGSNLTVHRDTPAVRDQLIFARAAFAAGVPSFGSCWAVHVAVTATGGACDVNPRGREFGVGRTITLNERGQEHPMFAGKPSAFAALTCHEDHVTSLGEHAEQLAGNAFSEVQAVRVRYGAGEFWAVQYHPEYELIDVAQLGILRSEQLIAQGFFAGDEDARRYMEELEALGAEPSRRDLGFRLGVGEDVLDREVRTVEVLNWLRSQVLRQQG